MRRGEIPSAAEPPVIVIGMHRSGTALLTRLLDDLGLFVGARLDSSHEALLFQRLNRWLLRQCGGAWDHPGPIDELIDDEELRGEIVSYLRDVLGSPRAASYLGLRRYLRGRGVDSIDEPWGWKDPRNTFTLPLWLDLFPDSKVVHIRRHGVDVASSLRRRRNERLQRRLDAYDRFPILSWFLLPGRFTDTVRCNTLEDGFELWEQYVERAQEHLDQRPDRSLAIEYETLLNEPGSVLSEVSEFAGLTTDSSSIHEAANRIDASRAFAYRDDPERRSFAERVSDRLAVAGY